MIKKLLSLFKRSKPDTTSPVTIMNSKRQVTFELTQKELDKKYKKFKKEMRNL